MNLTTKDLKEMIKFAKAEGLPRLKIGDFECEIPPKDATQKELEAIYKRLAATESICQRLALQMDERLAQRAQKPFSARVDLQRRTGES